MTKKQLKSEFKNVGFENSELKSLTCGITSIHY
jgi:ubiquinone/menaquinone biosynthesis C-methylase UbiE